MIRVMLVDDHAVVRMGFRMLLSTAVIEVVAEADGQLPAAGVGLEDPFASPAPLQARPWPRATLAAPSGRSYTAGFGDPAATASFYPFEPRPQSRPGDHGPARPALGDEDRQP